MSGKRIYMQRSIVELEKLVEEMRNDRTILQRVQNELDHRDTDRAARLRRKVTAILDELELNLAPSSPDKPVASEPHLPGINAPFLQNSARPKGLTPTRAQLQAMADNVMNKQESQPQDDPAVAAPVRTLFPTLMWEGIQSDFASLGAARALISELSSRLASMDEAGILRWWLRHPFDPNPDPILKRA